MDDKFQNRPAINQINIAIDCADAGIMADFYSKKLNSFLF